MGGGQLTEVLWWPGGKYAIFPIYLPGKPNIPRESPSHICLPGLPLTACNRALWYQRHS